MDTIDIKLAHYSFRFKPLTWREEFTIKFEKNRDRLRTILAASLVEVSGLPIKNCDDGYRVMEAIPSTIIERILLIFKGQSPTPRIFHTVGLYQAPEPNKFRKTLDEAEAQRDEIGDRLEREMINKFGAQEVREARELDRRILEGSKLRGGTAPSPDLPIELSKPEAPTTEAPKGEIRERTRILTEEEVQEMEKKGKPRGR